MITTPAALHALAVGAGKRLQLTDDEQRELGLVYVRDLDREIREQQDEDRERAAVCS